MALAPTDFGSNGGMLLVGNFGDGRIYLFDPSAGTLVGALRGANNTEVVIDGLWSLVFGNDTPNASHDQNLSSPPALLPGRTASSAGSTSRSDDRGRPLDDNRLHLAVRRGGDFSQDLHGERRPPDVLAEARQDRLEGFGRPVLAAHRLEHDLPARPLHDLERSMISFRASLKRT